MSDVVNSPLFTEPSRIEVDGLEVAYRRQGSGEPVVFLGGAEMTRRWLPLFERLSESCDLIVPEGPGFGDTALPAWVEGFDDLVLFHRDLAAALGLDSFHLVGYSLGGWIAAELAVFYPQLLRSLALIAPAGVRVPGRPRADTFNVSNTDRAELTFNGQAAKYADYVREGDEQETFFRAYAAAAAEALIAWNPRYDRKLDRRLPKVTCPALVIAAEHDLVVPLEHCERYAELLPAAELVTVAGEGEPTGHAIVAQEPDRLAAELATFFASARS